MSYREYDPSKDAESTCRILREAGWLKEGSEEAYKRVLAGSRTLVAEMDGEAECVVASSRGTMRYANEDLPFAAITDVLTSRVARKQGHASRLTAMAAALDAADGVLVSGLGMFDQGYYDRLGYGLGSYDRRTVLDPAALTVPGAKRAPRRLTTDDWQLIHESRVARHRGHGSCVLTEATTRFEMENTGGGFGLGYCDGPDGALSHHAWFGVLGDVMHGPYSVRWMAFQTEEQLRELLGVIRNLGDQVHAVRIADPPGVQLQVLMDKPFRYMRLSDKSRFETKCNAWAWCQLRICDLPGCLERTRLLGDEVKFNLKLADPIGKYLPDDAPWRGIEGDYVVTLGPSSHAESGEDNSLPTLIASVNSFTRLWLGVCPASCLAVTDDLSAPRELLEKLDWLIRLPTPLPDWDY
ncbi:MAG: GNAT family N-acetyltransferase [Phycisphaerales bacterium]|nr:MAG: GNAT family N-acetyltransferase [Phycisphaerales bacterium]